MLRRAISLYRSSLFRSSPAWIRVPAKPYSQESSSVADLPRLFVVQPRLRPDSALRVKLDEAVCLADSLGDHRDDHGVAEKEVPQHVVVQNPSARGHKAKADTYFGTGTVKTVKIHLNLVESKGDEVDAVFVNAMLSGVQQRNLEREWGKPVLDRVGLIIEIFHAHASTKEGKLQAELAALMYKKTRLVRVRGSDGRYTFGADGETEVVSARGRGSGGRGFIGGAGETEIHLQRRRISERRKILLEQIEDVRRTRALQRASRKRHGGSQGQALATIAVVGYTNAGKSTLVSALSNNPLFSDSRLFATVDPRLRNVFLPSGRKVILSDTVGFISDLPVQLVEAFHATLEEVVEADLLVHVLDSTAPNLEEHRSAVLSVLEQIGVSKEKIESMIEVWNKIDAQRVEGDEDLDGDKASNFSGGDENDMDDDQMQMEENNVGSPTEGENDIDDYDIANPDKVSYDHFESSNDGDQGNDHTDEWSESEDDQNSRIDEDNDASIPVKSTGNEQRIELSKELHCAKERSSPDVQTSALKRIGLQELLEVIDLRLKDQDDKLNPKHVLQRNVFDKKWRPQREDEETGVAT